MDSLLPPPCVRQLTVDGRFPDTTCGKAANPKDIQLTNFTLKDVPSAINTPQTGLYLLIGSMSKWVDLRVPEDAFRSTNKGMEFIRIETNRIDEVKSKLFMDMLAQKGFALPASYASGGPATCKDYDEGYLVLDANHKLFHLECTKERPRVEAIQLPEGVLPEYMFIIGSRSRRTLGYMVDSKRHFYVTNSDGSLMRSVLPGFDPAKDELTIFRSVFDRTVKLSANKDNYCYALDATDCSLTKEHAHKDTCHSASRLSFTSPDDRFVVLRF